jgi:two-component system, NtrC family, response regulator PilR
MSSILVVDDDQNLATALRVLLTRNNNVVDVVHTATAAKAILEQRLFDLVITDLRVSNESGLDIIETVKTVTPDTEVIMITGYGSIDTAVEAIRRGAADYLTKPFADAELLVVVEKALNHKTMKNELKHLRKAFAENFNFDNIIGNSSAVRKIIDVVKQVAPQDINVLIWGESGTGKELFAKAIHNNSSRRDAKFVAINCSAMPDLLLESELFGHVKGAFTSATSNKKGLFEEANGGTVFLDEVGDTSPSLQAKLLRVLQEEEIRPVGSNQTCKTNVRVIAATNRSLESLVSQGKFREDLYYRLNVISINLPALSQRREDIIPLANHFLQKYCKHFNKPVKRLTESACDKLIAHEWPGNVRELENTIKRAVALSNAEVIDVDSLFLMKPMPKIEPTNGDKHGIILGNVSLVDMQREHILKSLKENRWNYSITAGKLGIGRTTLWRKVKKYNIAKE